MGAVWIAALLVGAWGGGDGSAAAKVAPAAGPPAAELLGAVVATCADAQGAIEVRREGAESWEPAAVGTTLRQGDQIRAGDAGSARVRLLGGGHVELAANSSVVVQAGATATSLAAAAQGTAVAVPVETAVAAVPEPAPVEPEPEPEPEPQPEPTPPPPDEVALTGTDTPTDSSTRADPPPTPRRPPRPARPRTPRPRNPRPTYPESVSPAADARVACKPSVTLTWRGVAGATGYRVSIGKDLTFKSLVKFVELKGGKKTFYKFTPISAGSYAWRVAARNRDGRYGEYGYARRVRCTP